MGEGRRQLDHHLSVASSGLKRLRHSLNRYPLLSWLGSMSLLTTAATAAILYDTASLGMAWWLFTAGFTFDCGVESVGQRYTQ